MHFAPVLMPRAHTKGVAWSIPFAIQLERTSNEKSIKCVLGTRSLACKQHPTLSWNPIIDVPVQKQCKYCTRGCESRIGVLDMPPDAEDLQRFMQKHYHIALWHAPFFAPSTYAPSPCLMTTFHLPKVLFELWEASQALSIPVVPLKLATEMHHTICHFSNNGSLPAREACSPRRNTTAGQRNCQYADLTPVLVACQIDNHAYKHEPSSR
eukprot:1160256-Pelagomonas_calceolata.AAC.21